MGFFNFLKRKNKSNDHGLEDLENKYNFIFGKNNWHFLQDFNRNKDLLGFLPNAKFINPILDEFEKIGQFQSGELEYWEPSFFVYNYKIVVLDKYYLPLFQINSPRTQINMYTAEDRDDSDYQKIAFLKKNIQNFVESEILFIKEHNKGLHSKLLQSNLV